MYGNIRGGGTRRRRHLPLPEGCGGRWCGTGGLGVQRGFLGAKIQGGWVGRKERRREPVLGGRGRGAESTEGLAQQPPPHPKTPWGTFWGGAGGDSNAKMCEMQVHRHGGLGITAMSLLHSDWRTVTEMPCPKIY